MLRQSFIEIGRELLELSRLYTSLDYMYVFGRCIPVPEYYSTKGVCLTSRKARRFLEL